MIKKLLKQDKFIWRLIAIVIFIISTVHLIFLVYINNCTKQQILYVFFPPFTYILLNIFGIFFTLFLIFQPLKFELYGILSFAYSIVLLTDGCFSLMGILMYCVSITVLYNKGFYQKFPKIKIFITVLVFLIVSLQSIRYGLKVFFQGLISSLEYIFIFSIFLYILYKQAFIDRKLASAPILDLSKFPELSIRDKEWIKLLLTETKYSTIANQYKVTEGTVKNRMRQIFKILSVADRLTFIATYSKYELKE